MTQKPNFPAIGLDLATRAGFAIRTSEKTIIKAGENLTLKSGVLDLKVVTKSQATIKKPMDHPGLRFQLYRKFLIDKIEDYDLRAIYYEKPVGGKTQGGAMVQVAVGLEVITLEVASIFGIEAKGFHVNTIKKHATGSGKSGKDKQPMIDAALSKFPGQVWVSHWPTKRAPWTYDDNQADALHVLDYGLHFDGLL